MKTKMPKSRSNATPAPKVLKPTQPPITYKSSGVDIDKANDFVAGIQKMTKGTLSPAAFQRKGCFGALFTPDLKGYKKPVLVSSTDGVGTKLLLAKALNVHDTVGIDLVAMNVNDVLCTGAKPLFFLDYVACGKLDLKVLNAVMRGIVEGCRLAGCSLIGGETAEMPGMYKDDDYDLAGFTVGIVDEEKIIDGSTIKAGDCVVGLASSGIHSNGYSLVRQALTLADQKKYARQILAPTRIYVRTILNLIEHFKVKGLAHNTGGAFYEKLTKGVPAGLGLVLESSSWKVPEVFEIVQRKGNVPRDEMFKTFNMGVGMIAIVAAKDAAGVVNFLKAQGVESWIIGEVVQDSKKMRIN